MGDDYSLDYTGYTKCHPVSFDVYLPIEKVESWGEREGWQRIQAANSGVDARQ